MHSLTLQKELLIDLNVRISGSAPLWENSKANDTASDGMSRSTSISTLSKLDSIRSQNKGLWNNPSGPQTPNRHILSGRLSAPPTSLRKGPNSVSSGQRDSSDDESDSSLSDDKPMGRARPVTPPKPNILKQIRRSSTSQTVPQTKDSSLQPHSHSRPRRLWNNEMRSSKSEFNLSQIGRETPVRLRSNSTLSSNSGLWATPPLPQIQNETLDLSMTNPSTIPRMIHNNYCITFNYCNTCPNSDSRTLSIRGESVEFDISICGENS